MAVPIPSRDLPDQTQRQGKPITSITAKAAQCFSTLRCQIISLYIANVSKVFQFEQHTVDTQQEEY